MLTLFVQIFATFFVIGAFTFGGGYAVISMIQAQVVGVHGWISEGTFTDIVGISQMTPGPVGINCATYVGYDVVVNAGGSHALGITGSIVATLATVLPSFIIMLTIVKLYMKFSKSATFQTILAALRPSITGLIAAAAIVLAVGAEWHGVSLDLSIVRDNFPDWKSWCLFGGALAASLWMKAGPIALLTLGAVLGLLLY